MAEPHKEQVRKVLANVFHIDESKNCTLYQETVFIGLLEKLVTLSQQENNIDDTSLILSTIKDILVSISRAALRNVLPLILFQFQHLKEQCKVFYVNYFGQLTATMFRAIDKQPLNIEFLYCFFNSWVNLSRSIPRQKKQSVFEENLLNL